MVEQKKDKKEEEGRKYRVSFKFELLIHYFRYQHGSPRTKREGTYSQRRLRESSLSLRIMESQSRNQNKTGETSRTQTRMSISLFTRNGFSEVEGPTDPTLTIQQTKILKQQSQQLGKTKIIKSTNKSAKKQQARLEKFQIIPFRSRLITV